MVSASTRLPRSWENYAASAMLLVAGILLGALLLYDAYIVGELVFVVFGWGVIAFGILLSLAQATAVVGVDDRSVYVRNTLPMKTIPLDAVVSVESERVGPVAKCPTLVLRDGQRVRVHALISYPFNVEKRRQLLATAIHDGITRGR
jgi:hypothetical protein